jgi:cell division protein ZapE
MGRVLEAYEAGLAAGAIRADGAQQPVVAKLDGLAQALAQAPQGGGLLGRLFTPARPAMPRGIYIHGAVGRGKTMLMDLFDAAAPAEPRLRVHFHAFMQDVHRQLHTARQARARDAIGPVAAALARTARLLCLDEMQITDIADAMIIGRLFEALLAAGTVIVTTSNQAPEGLYHNGLNRQLFLPFIELIRAKFEVVALTGATDYRLGRVKAHETYLTPLGATAEAGLQDLWRRLTDTEHGGPVELDVLGRKLRVPEVAHACARFSFAELCGQPLGPPDYLALAQNFRTLFVAGIPVLGAAQRNEAKRFVMLIDTLYDARVRLVASAAAAPEELHPAGDHTFEFARTASRLREMQSASWWGKKIVET